MIQTLNQSKNRTQISLSRVLISLGILLVVVYASFVALPFFQGPSLEVSVPQTTKNGTTIIKGNTARVSSLTINDLSIPITESGSFAVERVFPPGYTVVVLDARDRFGRTKTQQLTFITYSPYTYALKKSNEKKGGSKETSRENGKERSEN